MKTLIVFSVRCGVAENKNHYHTGIPVGRYPTLPHYLWAQRAKTGRGVGGL